MTAAQTERVPILMYHQVSPEIDRRFGKYTVSPRMFAAQMAWLALARYQPVTLDALLDARSGQRLPHRPVVITFDDGFRDCVDYAVPILKRRGFTATFFLVAGLLGKTSRWLVAERGFEMAMIDASTARRLGDDGFSCGSHSMSHPRLAGLSPEACYQELAASRTVLEDHLGRAVPHLAYPFGSYDARARALAGEAGYRSACTVDIGLASPDDDPLLLRRVPVNGQESLLDFAARVQTAKPARQALRETVTGVRARLHRATPPDAHRWLARR